MIKLHLFSGFEKLSAGIARDTQLGHLYDDKNDGNLLADAAEELGVKRQRIQTSKSGLIHFDLWGGSLDRARKVFPTVSAREVAADIGLLSEDRRAAIGRRTCQE